MVKKRSQQNFSDDELRWMLVEKRRAGRKERLERFRRTGRAVLLAPDPDSASALDSLRSLPVAFSIIFCWSSKSARLSVWFMSCLGGST